MENPPFPQIYPLPLMGEGRVRVIVLVLKTPVKEFGSKKLKFLDTDTSSSSKTDPYPSMGALDTKGTPIDPPSPS
ncbi:MAG: hypothetical protein A2V86_04570 [Deltaproteobacteria bacterium RBG_16_49_23]|nr:MAG: hypothetical protein A2V86_04570 [Deltaproteobacteria bacterium RBG_16_49_23]